jgi:hypothetical protein
MLTSLALTVALSGQPHLISPPAAGPITRHIEQTDFQPVLTSARTSFTQAGSRDSLKNGAAIGAVVGDPATGLIIGYLCHVFNDNDMNCWPPALLWAGVGAGTGALVGAGVDALFERRVSVRATVKFRNVSAEGLRPSYFPCTLSRAPKRLRREGGAFAWLTRSRSFAPSEIRSTVDGHTPAASQLSRSATP